MPQEDLSSQSAHYPELIAQQALQSEQVQGSSEQLLASPEGYLELEQEAREYQQALALEFDLWASDLSETDLRERATPFVEAINTQRPNEPVDMNTVNRRFLQHLIRPEWHEHFPRDNTEGEMAKWHGFVSQWPEHIQDHLEGLLSTDAELRKQASDEALMREVAEIRSERLEVMRAASLYQGAERELKKLAARSTAIRAQAALSNRPLTKRERAKIEQLGQHQAETRERQQKALSSEDVVLEVTMREALKDSRDLRRGLLLTDQMQETIDYVLPSLMAGRPVLFIGDTGGAKTALAEYIAKQYFEGEYELVSGHDEANTYQLVGKTGLKAGDTTFGQGPLLRAMEQGTPLILDEINALPAGFIKRLNKVMQLRPGDHYVPQEDSGQTIVIKPGFCIIGTANEKNKRYKGVDDLSVEFQNRFGANVVRITYPDAAVPDGQPPRDNLRLALAFLRDRNGNIDPDIDLTEVGRFVRAAHVTQKLFTGSDIPDYVDPDVVREGLKEAVIAPRTIIDILAKVKEGNDLLTALMHFANEFKNPSDRKALKQILQKHHFDLGSERAK